MDPSREANDIAAVADACPSKGKEKQIVVEKSGNFKWNPHLLDILFDTLIEIGVKGGKKSDNGFGWGTINKCAQRFKDLGLGVDGRCPDAGVIKNKMQSLRTTYYLVRAAANASGFGMDNEGRIVADDNAWSEYVEAHPKAKDLRDKPFRYYDRMTQIYGNHMATGDSAYCVGDEDIGRSESQSFLHDLDANEDSYGCDLGSHSINMQGHSSNETSTNEPCSSRKRRCPLSPLPEENEKNPTEVTSPDRRRRRRSLPNFEVLDTSIEKMANAAEKMSIAAEKMADAHYRLAENEFIPTLEVVIATLRDMPDLQRHQVAHVIVKFGRDDKARSIFMALPEDDRKDFIMDLLDGN